MGVLPNAAEATEPALLGADLASPQKPHQTLFALHLDWRSHSMQFWLRMAVLAALVIWLYYAIGVKLLVDWYELPDYSYGFVVPFFAIYLLNRKAEELSHLRTSSSWGGIVLLAGALLLLLTGVLGADLFISRISFVVLIAALVWTFAGLTVLRHTKLILFLLLLAIPLPALILNQITFPLQLLASRLASFMLAMINIPVLRDGNVIQLSSMKLEVAEACSGIRSLMSLFTLAIIFGYFQEKTTPRRVFIALASIPIAVAANAVRIFGTGVCVQYWNPDKAQGFFHEFSGWVMFLVSLACLYGVHSLMQIFPRRKEVR